MGLGLFAAVGLLPRLGRGKLNDALDARFGEQGLIILKTIQNFKNLKTLHVVLF